MNERESNSEIGASTNLPRQDEEKSTQVPATYKTTMEDVASTLAVMEIGRILRGGGTVELPLLGITLTKEDLKKNT